MCERSVLSPQFGPMRSAAAIAALTFCAQFCPAASAKDGPAKVANTVKEDALATVTLSEQAEARLGVMTVVAEKKTIANPFILGGEVIAVPGKTATVSAPFSGKAQMATTTSALSAGQSVSAGQTIGRLLLLPDAEDLVTLEPRIESLATELRVAQAKAGRAEKLFESKGISERDLQAAQVERAQAQAVYGAAMARLKLVKGGSEGTNTGPGITLTSPLDGILTRMFVASGQVVPAGARLVEIVSQDPVWIRVPVFVGDVERIDRSQQAQVALLGGDATRTPIAAAPVQGPPLSNPDRATSDLYYQSGNGDGALRVGQKVMVSLPRRGSAERIVVPYAAVLYDMHGDTWVYVKIAPLTYARQRVGIRCVVEGMAVAERGLRGGEPVVTAGAAEIFGTEFGGGK